MIKNKSKKFNAYALTTNLLIVGLFLAVGFIALIATGVISASTLSLNIVLILAFICLLGVANLPWVKRLQNKEHKIFSIIILTVSAVMLVLWSVTSVLTVNCIFNAINDATFSISIVKLLRIVLIISMQYIITLLVSGCVLRYKKSYIPLQVIMYSSNLFLDFYATYFFLCLRISAEEGLTLSSNISLLLVKPMWVTLIISVLFTSLCYSLIRWIEYSKLKRITNNSKLLEDDSITIKLSKLNELKENNIISEEEYNKRKEDILSNI